MIGLLAFFAAGALLMWQMEIESTRLFKAAQADRWSRWQQERLAKAAEGWL